MIIKKALKNEPWEVESSWEWIPSEKREMKRNQEMLDQNILPFEKLYRDNHKQKKPAKIDPRLRDIHATLDIHHLNASPQYGRPKSAKIEITNIFENQELRRISKEQRERKKKEELDILKKEEQKHFETEVTAKNKNKNLLYFNARFEQKKNEDFIKYEDLLGWQHIPLIEELPEPPQKGKVPDNLTRQAHIEGKKFTNKQGNKKIMKDQENEPIMTEEERDYYGLNENNNNGNQNNKEGQSKSKGFNTLDYKKLQEQRESVRIQKEINKLMMAQNKNEIQSKEGKESFGVHRKKEVNSFLDMRKMMKVSTKVDKLIKTIKESGYPGKEFAVEHRDEMEEIAEKLAQRSEDSSLEQELDELEYDQGQAYEDRKLNKLKKETEKLENHEKKKKKSKKKMEKEGQDKEEGNKNQEQENNKNENEGNGEDLFGEEQAEKGDQAVGGQQDKIKIKSAKELFKVGKTTTFMTQEKVEQVDLRIQKTKDSSLKSKTAIMMDQLMKEIDFGEDLIIADDLQGQLKNQGGQQDPRVEELENNEDNDNQVILDEDDVDANDEQDKQKQVTGNKDKVKKQKQPPLPAVRFQNIKGWKIKVPPNQKSELDLAEQKEKEDMLIDQLKQAEEGERVDEDADIQDKQSLKSEQNDQENKNETSRNNETHDLGDEKKKQLWQEEVLQGNHRAYLDSNQNFDIKKFSADVDIETRDKAKEKAQNEIKAMENKTNKKIEGIKNSGSVKKAGNVSEKDEKQEKVNSRFQQSLKSIKNTLEHSKQDSSALEKKDHTLVAQQQSQNQIKTKKQAEQDAMKQLSNQVSRKQLKGSSDTGNEIAKHSFNFKQKEELDDDLPHPWM